MCDARAERGLCLPPAACRLPQTPRPFDPNASPAPAATAKGTEGLYPLLVRFAPPPAAPLRFHGLTADVAILDAFVGCYGLHGDAAAAAAAGVARFPVECLRLLRRPVQRVLVLVSAGLDDVAMSEKWSPATDVGLFLAAMPTGPPSAAALQFSGANRSD